VVILLFAAISALQVSVPAGAADFARIAAAMRVETA
jgi:hypothetical protein